MSRRRVHQRQAARRTTSRGLRIAAPIAARNYLAVRHAVAAKAETKHQTLLYVMESIGLTEWCAFRDRPVRPLRHLSEGQLSAKGCRETGPL